MKILTIVYGGLNQPSAEELDRREAADEWPRVRLYEKQVNSDMLDERTIAAIVARGGARAALYKRVPIGVAQALEAFSQRKTL